MLCTCLLLQRTGRTTGGSKGAMAAAMGQCLDLSGPNSKSKYAVYFKALLVHFKLRLVSNKYANVVFMILLISELHTYKGKQDR